MPSDHESGTGSERREAIARSPGPVAASELLARVRAELPAVAGLGPRGELLAAAWLTSLRSPRTRRAYAGDLRGWLSWLGGRGVDVLEASRVHVDLWVAGQQDLGAEASSVRRRLSALSSFYRYCAVHDLVSRIPITAVARPGVDPDYTATVGCGAAYPGPFRPGPGQLLPSHPDADRPVHRNGQWR